MSSSVRQGLSLDHEHHSFFDLTMSNQIQEFQERESPFFSVSIQLLRISHQPSPCHQTALTARATAAMLENVPAMQLTMVTLIPTLDPSEQRIQWVLGSNLPPTSLHLMGAKQDIQPHAPLLMPFLAPAPEQLIPSLAPILTLDLCEVQKTWVLGSKLPPITIHLA